MVLWMAPLLHFHSLPTLQLITLHLNLFKIQNTIDGSNKINFSFPPLYILSQKIVGVHTSREVWQALESMFSLQSNARVINLQVNLASFKKGSQSIVKYLKKMKSYADTLVTIRQPLTDCELISYILVGLGINYDPLITSITTRLEPMNLQETYGHLLNYELRLEQQHASLNLHNATANIVSRQSSNNGRTCDSNNFSKHSQNQHNKGQRRHRNQKSSFNGSQLVCQVCNKPGHTTLKCYHRFDFAYQAEQSNNFQAHMSTTPPSQIPAGTLIQPQLTISPRILKNLTLQADEYVGTDQIMVVNGVGLPIQHIGASQIYFPCKNLLLNQPLQVPSFEKNLVSVSKFT